MPALINWFVTACHVCFCWGDRTSLTKTNDETGELVSKRTDSLTECWAACVWVVRRVNAYVRVCVCLCVWVPCWYVSVSTRICQCLCLCVLGIVWVSVYVVLYLAGGIPQSIMNPVVHESHAEQWLICVVTLWGLLMHADELCLNSLHSQETI